MEIIVQKKKLSELNPAKYNPRDIDDVSLDGLKSSLSEFGRVSLIVWNKRTGNIVGGHQRYKILVSEGETEDDVVVVDLPDDKEKALNLTLNNRHNRGDWSDFSTDLIGSIANNDPEISNKLRFTELIEHINKIEKMEIVSNDKKDRDETGKKETKKEKKEKYDSTCSCCGLKFNAGADDIMIVSQEEMNYHVNNRKRIKPENE